MGALLSGLLFQADGSIACPVGSSAMLAACAMIAFALPTEVKGAGCRAATPPRDVID